MNEDKNIKMLLQEYGVEETSQTFNNSIMQKIAAETFADQAKPLLSNFILSIIKIVFVLIIIAVIVSVMFGNVQGFSFTFSGDANNNIYKQLFSFIIVFWIVMFINIWLTKKWRSGNTYFL